MIAICALDERCLCSDLLSHLLWLKENLKSSLQITNYKVFY